LSDLNADFVQSVERLFGNRATMALAALSQHGHSEVHYEDALPQLVVYAHNTEEVSELLKLANQFEVPVTPYGAGTSVEGNALPVHGGVCVDLSEMDSILAINQADLDCTVQAGVRREQLNDYLRDTGLFFPIDPGANATIGGMASTRASGTNAVRYGTMREAVLSLRVVLPDGKIVRTSQRAKKSAAGYDLTRLFVGSEGTLGIITEITLRLHGIPETISAAVCPFNSLGGAVDTVVQIIQIGLPIARVEILDSAQMRAVNRWSQLSYAEQPTLFFEFHGSQAYVLEQIETAKLLSHEDGGGEFSWADKVEDRNRLWKARHEAYYAAVNVRPNAVGWTSDVCVPISRLAECIELTQHELAEMQVPATILGHVGDGNFHVIFSIDPTSVDELRAVEEFNKRLISRAVAMDGTCTGEHGIGIGKKACLLEELGDDVVALMRSIKGVIDPKGIMNPGKIFDL